VPVAAVTCPSCGAQLREAADGEVLGVTQIDPSATSRLKRIKPRRFTAWLTGEAPVEDNAGGKIEPPSEEVRREMLRLELAAIDAEIEAKALQAKAEAVAEAAEKELPPEDAEKELPPEDAAGAS
jgi:hypothetical protein